MTAQFPRFLTIEEAAQRLGVSVARISMWIGECKLPVAARSEYAGFLLHTLTVKPSAAISLAHFHQRHDPSLCCKRCTPAAGRVADQLCRRSPPASSLSTSAGRT